MTFYIYICIYNDYKKVLRRFLKANPDFSSYICFEQFMGDIYKTSYDNLKISLKLGDA